MLVEAINHRHPGAATPSTVEGPFHVPDAPPVAHGGDMAKGAPGIPCFVTGKVSGLDGRIPVVMALAARKSYDEHRPVRLDELAAHS